MAPGVMLLSDIFKNRPMRRIKCKFTVCQPIHEIVTSAAHYKLRHAVAITVVVGRGAEMDSTVAFYSDCQLVNGCGSLDRGERFHCNESRRRRRRRLKIHRRTPPRRLARDVLSDIMTVLPARGCSHGSSASCNRHGWHFLRCDVTENVFVG